VIHILEWVRIEEFTAVSWCGVGCPPFERAWLANAFVAKAVLGLATTVGLIERLTIDRALRRICGFPQGKRLPSEITFSRTLIVPISKRRKRAMTDCACRLVRALSALYAWLGFTRRTSNRGCGWSWVPAWSARRSTPEPGRRLRLSAGKVNASHGLKKCVVRIIAALCAFVVE
jgi:hypothetical protein